MSGMPRGGLLAGVDLVGDVEGRGLGAGEVVIEGVVGVDAVDVEANGDGVMGGEGGEGDGVCCALFFWHGHRVVPLLSLIPSNVLRRVMEFEIHV